MQKNSITPTPVNKVQIVLTKKKMTAYGGFALIAAFFRQIGFADMIEHALPVIESSPNGMGIYGKVIAYAAMVYAGAERFSHLAYLGFSPWCSGQVAFRLPRRRSPGCSTGSRA